MSDYIGIRISTDQKEELKKIAEKEGRSLSNLIKKIIAGFIERSTK